MGNKKVRHMRTQALLASLVSGKPRKHQTCFSVQERPEGWWIHDHDHPIAFIHRKTFCFDPFEFSPFRRLTPAPTCHPLYDSSSRNAMCLTLTVNVNGNHRAPDKAMDIRWTKRSGSKVVLQIWQEYLKGVKAMTTLQVGYSSERGAYTYDLSCETREPPPFARREFCNFYAVHLGDGIPRQKKWQYTLWTGHDGQLWKMPHNSALTFCARRGNLVKRFAPGGFIGLGAEPDFNPVVIFKDSNVPLYSGTCDMWFDEHLSYEPPTLEHIQDNEGVAKVSLEVVNAPSSAMRRLLAKARLIPLSAKEASLNPCPPLAWNRVCDMEKPLDPRVPSAGMVFVPGYSRWIKIIDPETGKPDPAADGKTNNLSEWAPGTGHSGKRCLKLSGVARRQVTWGPAGHAFHTKPETQYRFEAWVRTTGKAKAGITLVNAWRKWDDAITTIKSPLVSSRSWRKLSMTLTTKDYPYIYPTLITEGEGAACFDDLFIGPERTGRKKH